MEGWHSFPCDYVCVNTAIKLQLMKISEFLLGKMSLKLDLFTVFDDTFIFLGCPTYFSPMLANPSS